MGSPPQQMVKRLTILNCNKLILLSFLPHTIKSFSTHQVFLYLFLCFTYHILTVFRIFISRQITHLYNSTNRPLQHMKKNKQSSQNHRSFAHRPRYNTFLLLQEKYIPLFLTAFSTNAQGFFRLSCQIHFKVFISKTPLFLSPEERVLVTKLP